MKEIIEFEKIRGILFDYGYQLLHRLGWWIILDQKTSSVIQFLKEGDEELTYKQKETLEFWCAVNGIDYETFIPRNLLQHFLQLLYMRDKKRLKLWL